VFLRSNILIAIDGSEIGWKALNWAFKFAKSMGSDIVIIHVAPPGFTIKQVVNATCEAPISIVPEPPECVKERILKVLEVLEEARRRAEEVGLKVDFVLRHGDPSREIVKETSKGYSLVIIGHRGFSKHRFGLGSIAEKIVREAQCSVFVVK